MSYIWTLWIWIHISLFIFLFLIAAFGRRLGLRKAYVRFLLKLFQFSQKKVEKKRRQRLPSQPLDESDVIEETRKLSFSQPTYLGLDTKGCEGFKLDDILEYITAGVSAIVEDSVITTFVSEEPPYWNLLSRNNSGACEFVSFRLTMIWMIGFFVRYFFFLPSRLIILLMGMGLMMVCTIVVGCLPDGPLKRKLNGQFNIFCFDFVAASLSLFATFHNPENKPKSGIAVANHTSPIDSMILCTDNVYDMVGQIHGGLMGYYMTLLSRSSTHIWFERSSSKDRSEVAKKLKEHTATPGLPPILIFPEGVCVNNTSVVQFKKGAFEIDSVIYPVAIRFDPRFGDAFWWQDAFFSYVMYMMTSWAIVCDVWYLPPVTRKADETAIAFANRVKALIAAQGGFSDLAIDGFLKTQPPKADVKLRYQQEFARHCYLPIKEEDEYKERPIDKNLAQDFEIQSTMKPTTDGSCETGRVPMDSLYDELRRENQALRHRLKALNPEETFEDLLEKHSLPLSSTPVKKQQNELKKNNFTTEELEASNSDDLLQNQKVEVLPNHQLIQDDNKYVPTTSRSEDQTGPT